MLAVMVVFGLGINPQYNNLNLTYSIVLRLIPSRLAKWVNLTLMVMKEGDSDFRHQQANSYNGVRRMCISVTDVLQHIGMAWLLELKETRHRPAAALWFSSFSGIVFAPSIHFASELSQLLDRELFSVVNRILQSSQAAPEPKGRRRRGLPSSSFEKDSLRSQPVRFPYQHRREPLLLDHAFSFFPLLRSERSDGVKVGKYLPFALNALNSCS